MGIHSEVITTFVPKPKGKKTAAYKIWHYPFLVHISQMHLVSTEFLTQGGSPTSGNAQIDRNMANEKMQAQFTIAALTMLHDEGTTFSLVEPADSARIYLIIREHLNDWMTSVQNSPNMIEIPIDDLRKLEALAKEIYVWARHYMQEQPFHGTLLNRIAALQARRGGFQRQAPPKTPGAIQKKINEQPLQHTPMADAIAQTVGERKKLWR